MFKEHVLHCRESNGAALLTASTLTLPSLGPDKEPHPVPYQAACCWRSHRTTQAGATKHMAFHLGGSPGTWQPCPASTMSFLFLSCQMWPALLWLRKLLFQLLSLTRGRDPCLSHLEKSGGRRTQPSFPSQYPHHTPWKPYFSPLAPAPAAARGLGCSSFQMWG